MIAWDIEGNLAELGVQAETGDGSVFHVVTVAKKSCTDAELRVFPGGGKIAGVDDDGRYASFPRVSQNCADGDGQCSGPLVAVREPAGYLFEERRFRDGFSPAAFAVHHELGSEVRVRDVNEATNRRWHYAVSLLGLGGKYLETDRPAWIYPSV